MGERQANSGDDTAFLDLLLDAAVAAFQDGRTPDVTGLLQGHQHLLDAAQDIILLAREIAKLGVFPPIEAPPLKGYQLISALGRGGMGTVFLARQERLGGRPVAVKVLPTAAALSPRARERFLTEARALARIRHPHVVAIHDVIDQHGVLAYAMELVDGPSLADVIRERTGEGNQSRERKRPVGSSPLVRESLLEPPVRGIHSPDLEEADRNPLKSATEKGFSVEHGDSWHVEISRLGICVARALGEVHRAGLLHRDVKPSNILLRRDGTPLLSDFGLVREVDSTLTQQGHFAGTPAYAPPEQLRGETERIDVRSDVYALGVTLYHALALRLPFRGDDPSALLRQVEAGRGVPLRKVNPRLPRELETIVAKAMDPDPDRRYPSADELADDLERMLSLQPIHARPAGPVTRTLKLVRRNRGAALGILVGSVVSLGLAVAATVYVFIVPTWVATHVAEARLALIQPRQGTALYNREFFGARSAGLEPDPLPLDKQVADAALVNYASALRLSPLNPDIRRERDIVLWARDFGSASLPTAQKSQPGGSHGLRNRGLYAFLTGNIDAAIDAWAQFDLESLDPEARDPFVDAALGLLYVNREEYPMAYPRLQNACEAFPNVGFLAVHLAEAALHCGDVNKAQRWLDQARGMPRLDPYEDDVERVQAELHVARGENELAMELFQRAGRNLDHGHFPHGRYYLAAIFRFGQFLESRDRLPDAVHMYATVVQQVPLGAKPRRALVAAMDRWWEGLPLTERWKLVRQALDEDRTNPDSFIALLKTYSSTFRFFRPSAAHSPPNSSPSSQRTETVSLPTLAQRMEVMNMTAWNCRRTLPSNLKDALANAWVTPEPTIKYAFITWLTDTWCLLETALVRIRTRTAATLAIFAIGTTTASGQAVWDLTADWSDVSNPNGVWSYNEGNNPLPHWNCLYCAYGFWTEPQPAWAPTETSCPFIFLYNGTRTDPVDLLEGDVVVHSTDGNCGAGNGLGNIRWTSPVNSPIDISGAVWIGHDIGRSNNWALYRNSTLLTSGSVSDGDPYSRASPFDLATGSGGASILQDLPVSVGDVIRLEITATSGFGSFVGIILTITSESPCDPGLDCNANGTPDACDISGGTSQDCNTNGTPDECDIGGGTSADCNANFIPDECEGTRTWDLGTDWSYTTNPNGVWTLNRGPGSPMSSVVPDWFGSICPSCCGDCFSQPHPAWADNACGAGASAVPAWIKALEANSCTYGLDLPIGRVAVHGSKDAIVAGPAGVTWTSPIDGVVEIRGGVWLGTYSFGRDMDWELFHDGERLTGGHLDAELPYSSASPFDYRDGDGGPNVVARSVAVGDVINLEILRIPGQHAIWVGIDLSIVELASGTVEDCNSNGIPDGCDINGGTSQDCDTNGVPDECQPGEFGDYDGDGLIDPCDPDMDDDGVANAADVCDFTPAGATVQPDGSLRSDIDGDCDVDLADHAIMAEEFTGPRT